MGGKELAPLLLLLICFFVSRAQTPLPLIHPTDSISGGAERGESQNQGGDDCAFAITIWTAHFQFIMPAANVAYTS